MPRVPHPPADRISHRVAGRRRVLRTLATLVGCGLVSVRPAPGAGQFTAVLVAGSGLDITAISNRDVRKLYLGFGIEQDGLMLEPVVNRTDPRLYEEFLQKILFMSDGNYRRHMASRVFRMGGRRPLEVASLDELVAAINERPGRLSFLWRHKADTPQLRVVGGLW